MLTIAIPVYNEEERLERTVAAVDAYLAPRFDSYEIIVVSNGSTDRTNEIGSALMESNKALRFFTLPSRGPGLAFARAVGAARGEYLVTLDADLSSSIEFISTARTILNAGAALVLGSKSLGTQRRTIVRVAASQLYIFFAQLCLDLPLSDYSIGSKAFRTSLLRPLVDRLDPWTGFVFEICVYCKLHKLQTIEVPIECEDLYRSRFNLLHEGLYRYRHLYRTWRLAKDPGSWLNHLPPCRVLPSGESPAPAEPPERHGQG